MGQHLNQRNQCYQYNAALYLRLSKDDGNENEISGIATQKEMLTRYCKENK